MLLYVIQMPNVQTPMDLILVELANLDILELELLDVLQFVLLLAKMEELVPLLILVLVLLDLLDLNANLLLGILLEMYLPLPLAFKILNRAQLKLSLLFYALH